MKRTALFVLLVALLMLALGVTLSSCKQQQEPLGVATGSLTVVGATALNGGLTMDTSKFTVADTSGNTVVAGTFKVQNTATITGTGGLVSPAAYIGGGYYSTGCTGASTGTWKCTGGITSDGAILGSTGSFTSTLGVTGESTLGLVKGTAQSNVTVTADSTIAVTAPIVPLTAAGTVGTATITGCNTAGRVTILRNVAAQTITLTDTGTLMLGGDAALAQYDTLVLLGDGTNCLQIAKTDN